MCRPRRPKAAPSASIEDGDRIEIDIPARTINALVDGDIASRGDGGRAPKAWKPAEPRTRKVSTALRAYAAFATSAARGAVREVP